MKEHFRKKDKPEEYLAGRIQKALENGWERYKGRRKLNECELNLKFLAGDGVDRITDERWATLWFLRLTGLMLLKLKEIPYSFPVCIPVPKLEAPTKVGGGGGGDAGDGKEKNESWGHSQ